MDLEAIRRCMSFGFSEKKDKCAIGQCMNIFFLFEFFSILRPFLLFLVIFGCRFTDGNGFKTSSMRLGADVIVFSRHQGNRSDFIF